MSIQQTASSFPRAKAPSSLAIKNPRDHSVAQPPCTMPHCQGTLSHGDFFTYNSDSDGGLGESDPVVPLGKDHTSSRKDKKTKSMKRVRFVVSSSMLEEYLERSTVISTVDVEILSTIDEDLVSLPCPLFNEDESSEAVLVEAFSAADDFGVEIGEDLKSFGRRRRHHWDRTQLNRATLRTARKQRSREFKKLIASTDACIPSEAEAAAVGKGQATKTKETGRPRIRATRKAALMAGDFVPVCSQRSRVSGARKASTRGSANQSAVLLAAMAH